MCLFLLNPYNFSTSVLTFYNLQSYSCSGVWPIPKSFVYLSFSIGAKLQARPDNEGQPQAHHSSPHSKLNVLEAKYSVVL
jgi:hypothetical protein